MQTVRGHSFQSVVLPAGEVPFENGIITQAALALPVYRQGWIQ